VFLWHFATSMAAEGKPVLALACAGGSLILGRAIMLATEPWEALTASPLFDPSLYSTASFWMPSLGGLLLHVVILVFIAALARTLLRSRPLPARALIAAVIGLVVLILFATGINAIIISLVRDSRLHLDLFRVQDFDLFSILSLLLIAGSLLAWSLLADTLVRWLHAGLTRMRWGVLLAVVFALSHFVHHLTGEYDSVLALWPLPAFVAILLMYFDQQRVAYWMLLVVSCAAFSAHLLNRQTFKRLERERGVVAENALSSEDPVIELLFREAERAMMRDPGVNALLSNDTGSVNAAGLDSRVRREFFSGPWENYDVRLSLFRKDGPSLGSTSPDDDPSLASLRSRFEQGIPVSEDRSLRNTHRPTENALYIGMITAAQLPNVLFIELYPRAQPEGIGFPELLLAGERDRMAEDHFLRARYERGMLVENNGLGTLPTRWTLTVPGDGMHFSSDGADLLAVGNKNGTLIVLGIPEHTWTEHATTFSYLFVLYALVAAAWSLLSGLLRDGRRPALDLSAKLRAGILAFAGLALLLFAFGSQRLLRDHYAQRSEELLEERMRSAIADLRQHVHLESTIAPEQLHDLDHWVDDASTILLTDLSIYSPSGRLWATSREQVFNSGLLGTRMHPDAYMALAVQGLGTYSHDERIGQAVFHTAYRPLRSDRGQVLGYLALPYFARQSEIDQERTAGYVAIVNLFVLLFVLSVIAAALIANWSTRPLQLLKRGLEHIELGARNEPIAYTGKDELGELVRVYNTKVEELRESAERLARSERESAWREMARQVAHEIKNPLTPMKLGIQHFRHVWDPAAPDAKEKLDRFTASMVEQIDALSRVAGDFSRFAQMSAAHETLLDLNEVAKSAVALFAGEPNAEIALQTTSPLMVKADREHLLRVFNNLIKNALQAVPENRRGLVNVVLSEEDGHAIAEVRDNGTGIPEEARERIFTPSFTTKSSGMGLGLALVKRMVEQADGTVWFTTQEHEGTSFFVRLPLSTRM
jgi:two-component system, NtrC family, nitrogen regulation sensor histidine kinase NtrY